MNRFSVAARYSYARLINMDSRLSLDKTEKHANSWWQKKSRSLSSFRNRGRFVFRTERLKRGSWSFFFARCLNVTELSEIQDVISKSRIRGKFEVSSWETWESGRVVRVYNICHGIKSVLRLVCLLLSALSLLNGIHGVRDSEQQWKEGNSKTQVNLLVARILCRYIDFFFKSSCDFRNVYCAIKNYYNYYKFCAWVVMRRKVIQNVGAKAWKSRNLKTTCKCLLFGSFVQFYKFYAISQVLEILILGVWNFWRLNARLFCIRSHSRLLIWIS